jgi:hypothetical protein
MEYEQMMFYDTVLSRGGKSSETILLRLGSHVSKRERHFPKSIKAIG